METSRYTCTKCNRFFVASSTAAKVNCPSCGESNILRPDLLPPEKPRASYVQETIPHYSFPDGGALALKYIKEDPDHTEGWSKVVQNHDGIDAYQKPIALDINKNEVQVVKASTNVDASPNIVLNAYWNPQSEMNSWNAQTVSKMQILEDLGSVQSIYQVHKPNARINLTNDVVYKRSYDKYGSNGYWISCVSESGRMGVNAPNSRANLIFGGLLIESQGNNKCKVTLIWAFDINKPLHVQFVDEEPKKVATRLFRLRKKIGDDFALAQATAQYENVKAQAQHHLPDQSSHTGGQTGQTGKALGCTVCRKKNRRKVLCKLWRENF